MTQIIKAAFTIILAVAVVAVASPRAQSTSLTGVWKTVEVTTTGPGARTVTHLQPNLTIVAGTHYARVETHSDGPRPVLADPAKATADELRAAWGPFFGEAGTYEVSGSELTTRPIVTRNPASMTGGAFTVYGFVMSGNTLTLTSKRTQAGPVAYPVAVKAVRVE